MKKAIFVFLAAASILQLSSCGAFYRLYTSVIDSPSSNTSIRDEYNHAPEETYADTVIELSEQTAITDNIDSELVPETDENAPPVSITELPENVSVYYFCDGQAAVIYSDKYAWVFDFAENRVVPIVDLEAMLAVFDPSNRAEEYFRDTALSLKFTEYDRELHISMTITSNTHDAACTFACYYCADPLSFQERGLRGYYLTSAYYPGSDEPHTVDSTERLYELGLTEEMSFYKTVCAIMNSDVNALEEALYLEKGVLASWEGIEITNCTVTRENMTHAWIDELIIDLTVAKSPLERLPVGDYRVRVSEGLFTDLEFKSKNSSDAEVVLNEAEEWLLPYVESFGGAWKPEEQTPEGGAYVHNLMDLFLMSVSWDEDLITVDGFVEFCRLHFGIEDISVYINEDELLKHGGHGLYTYLCEIVNDYTASGIHFITVDFFADPMKTVVAFTQEYVLTETDGSYRLDEVRRTYDSGLPAFGWGT